MSEIFYFNFGDLKKLADSQSNKGDFFANLQSIITIKGASYNDEPLKNQMDGEENPKEASVAADLKAALATKLLEKDLVTPGGCLEWARSKEGGKNVKKFKLPEVEQPVPIQRQSDLGGVFSAFYRVFTQEQYKCTAEPRALLIFFEQVHKADTEEKWKVLEKEHPELYHLLQTAMQEKKDEQPDNSSKKAETFSDLPDLPRNRIFAGAPGTGKSRELNRQAEKPFGENIVRVTFHPEYSYYDFVGSYRPKMSKKKGDKIVYGFVEGPFTRILKQALEHPATPYCLIIEEINRARVAAVFGDIFQLLDRYSKNDTEKGHVAHESEYPIEPSEELAEHLADSLKDHKLRIPANLYIWATMNSADQGVFPMDTAFKRRWSFEYQPLNESKDVKDKWDNIRRGINKVLLEKHVNEDKLMGYYFLKEEERKDDKALQEALRGKVLMYLFDDAAKPFRKDIFKGTLLYSELRDNLKLEADDLGIFKDIVNPEMHETTGEQPNSGEDKGGRAADDENDSDEGQ